ncbi:MAG: pyruvate kinase [Candidatus Methanofastidiosia archaeon]
MKKTKIVCTLGPACDYRKILEEMILSGMDIARFNFSHENHKIHKKRIDLVREISQDLKKPVAILQDLAGPEIRLGEVSKGTFLKKGDEFFLTTKKILGNSKTVNVGYEKFPNYVFSGDRILIDDGYIELEVLDALKDEVRTRILDGGELKSRKSVNVPNRFFEIPAITEKDLVDVEFGIKNNVDFIALSFVTKSEDILDFKKISEDIDIIAKIEHPEAVKNIDSIIKVSDGVMVARGDLGVEVPPEEVPLIQKMIIRKCNLLLTPVITATQMLESMIENPRPTRAEASDVANAIFDGTDAVMLSGETSVGKYPVESVRFIKRIAKRAESVGISHEKKKIASIRDAISESTYEISQSLNVKIILTPTKSGNTARLISQYRPKVPILALCVDEKTQRNLLLWWGIIPKLVKRTETTDEMLEIAVSEAKKFGLEKGDLAVITAGIPIGSKTNMIKVQRIGEKV